MLHYSKTIWQTFTELVLFTYTWLRAALVFVTGLAAVWITIITKSYLDQESH